MITVEQIDQWLVFSAEDAHLEFKKARNQYSFDRLCEYCVAIANEGGGHLVLGVTDQTPRKVVGSRAFENPTKTVESVRDRAGFHIRIDVVEHPDGRVVVVSIPPRPSGTAYQLDGRYLMRSGESLVAMTEDRLRAIFDEGKPNWLNLAACEGLTRQEVIDALDTQTYFEMLGESFPTDGNAILDRLLRERLIVAQDGSFALTRLAGILLARRLSDFEDIERKAPRVVVYSGESKIDTRLDQIGAKGYAVGFQGLIQFIMSQLPQNEVIEDAVRKEVKLLPDLAVRELVANALVHQDFTQQGSSVMIEIYSNRVEVSNPGSPIVELDRFIDGYQSRNEGMANIMRRMGVCEEKGSGIDKVVYTAEAYQLPAPAFREEYGRTSVVLAGPKPFDEMDRDERIRACYQHAGLKRVMNDHMTNQSLRERFKLPDSRNVTVSQIITATVEAGLIKVDDSVGQSRKYRRYLPYWA